MLTDLTRQLHEITAQESSVVLVHFTADDAFELGTALRSRLRTLSQSPAVVNITLANRQQLLYHATSRSGTQPDNDLWIARKRATVLRFGVSSWYMHNKMEGNEIAFAAKYALGAQAGDYAIHGGGVPIRVQGVEGVVGVAVVSGLAQDEDHMIVVEGLQELLETQKKSPEPYGR